MLLDCYKPTFARKFIAGSSQYLEVSSAALNSYPLTMACWFNRTSNDILSALMSIGTNGGSERVVMFAGDSANSNHVIAATQISNVQTSTGYIANTWSHAAVTFSSSPTCAYLNGGGKGSGTLADSLAAANSTNIGCRWSTTRGAFADASIAWPAIWNIALGDADIARLASGAHPLTVRKEAIVAFWDFDGREKEFGIKAAYPLTNSGSVPVNGPSFLRTRVTRPWMLGAGYVAATGNRRRRVICAGAY